MSWIILALTLGASITSIIHGVFMLFGSLTISTAAIPGIPSTMLAVLPIISAVFALIGGIIAFNQSKWGALFLIAATALCAPARDTWLYGGLYFFAALLCFFLRPRQQGDYDYEGSDYDEELEEGNRYGRSNDDDGPDFYYAQDLLPERPKLNGIQSDSGTLDDDISPQVNNEPPKIRRRMTKVCPECMAVVSRESHYCPSCGAKLFVAPSDDIDDTPPEEPKDEPEMSLDDQLLMPTVKIETEQQLQEHEQPERFPESFNDNDENDGDDDMSSAAAIPANYRVQVSRRNIQAGRGANSDLDDAASSYQEFSKYTRRSKKRKRSAGRKILSIMLLIAAVGGSLYFLLGLRKLPPGDLPPMVRPEVVQVSERQRQNDNANSRPLPSIEETIAQPVEVPVAENQLPNFTPERTPSSGTITGNGVNVRADHTTSANRITRLNGGTKVDIIGSYNVPSGQFAGIWYNIRTGGRDGWVYGRYVQPLGSGLPAGYSNALLKSFGSTKSQLVEALGNPTRNTSSSAEWPGLTATLRGEDITRLRLTSSNRELQNGLKTGMSQTALLQVMGYPSSVTNRTWNYNEGNKTGVSVQLGTNNSVSNITVSEIQ